MNVEVVDEEEGGGEVKEEEEEEGEVKEEEEEGEIKEEGEVKEEIKEEIKEEEPPKREISEKEMDDQFLHLCIRVHLHLAYNSLVLPWSGRRGPAYANIYISHQVPLTHRIHQ